MIVKKIKYHKAWHEAHQCLFFITTTSSFNFQSYHFDYFENLQSKEILNINNTRIAYEDEDEIVFEDCSKAGLWNYIMSAKLGKECFGTYLIVFKNKFKSVDKSE